MTFTPLHRSLGLAPSALTDEILDQAVAAGVAETDDLDWKTDPPPTKNLADSDVPKDIAAMANSGGGMIVYGVTEDQKVATGRKDTGDFTENHERTYRRVAVTAITPPVFGLEVHRLGTDLRAVAVVVPASVDGPHLIYRNDYFGAPVRNHADTEWMKERQIEAMYRARFDEQRRSNEAVDSLYAEAAAGRDTGNRAWLVAVAHPRVPGVLARPSREGAVEVLQQALATSLVYCDSSCAHPLERVVLNNPRPGLRRWVAPSTAPGEMPWRESWVSVHHDGSVTLVTAVGGHMKYDGSYFEAWQVKGRVVEAAVADFTALIRTTAAALGYGEYDVRVGIEWAGDQPLTVLTVDGSGWTYDGVSTPLSSYTPVRSTINATGSDAAFHRQVYELAQDCVNQGGITHLHGIKQPAEDDA